MNQQKDTSNAGFCPRLEVYTGFYALYAGVRHLQTGVHPIPGVAFHGVRQVIFHHREGIRGFAGGVLVQHADVDAVHRHAQVQVHAAL